MTWWFLFSLKLAAQIICPPGTVQLEENLFIDQTYISNESWKEYVADMTQKQTFFYLPDTTIEVRHKNYYFDKKFNDFPVLLNDSLAIESFIKWRTTFINSSLDSYSDEALCKSPFYVAYYKSNLHVQFRLALARECEASNNIIQSEMPETTLNLIKNKKLFSFRCMAWFIEQ